MNNIKQTQANYDNQLPPDRDEFNLIEEMAQELVECGVINTMDEQIGYIHLDDLEVWTKDAKYKSILIQSKINRYEQLQLDLCECMITELINHKGE